MKEYLLVSIMVNWLYLIWAKKKKAEMRKNSPRKLYEKALFYVSRSNAKEDLLKIPVEYREMFSRTVGKVVASFEIGSIETVLCDENKEYITPSYSEDELIKLTCVSKKEMSQYMPKPINREQGIYGYIWIIQDFTMLKEYKELSLYSRPGQSYVYVSEKDFLR